MRKAKITVAILATVILSGFAWLLINSGITEEKLQSKTIKLESTEKKLDSINIQVEKLKTQSSKEKEHKEELQKQLEQKEKEKQELEAKLVAKAQAKAKLELAASNAEKTLTATHTASATAVPSIPGKAITGNKQTWLAASGIPESEWQYVDAIVSRESGWNPCAYNPGQSNCNAMPTSACGLAQSLPCGKQNVYGHWTDPVANLKWQYDYVRGRYGGYAQAVAFWNIHKWY